MCTVMLINNVKSEYHKTLIYLMTKKVQTGCCPSGTYLGLVGIVETRFEVGLEFSVF